MSKRGRPRKPGKRQPCGRLAPADVEPNQIVVDLRRALLGDTTDLTQAADPMSLAHARGWLTEAHHRAGTAFAVTWRTVHGQSHAGPAYEAPEPGGIDRRSILEMGYAEIAEAWDTIVEETRRSSLSDERQRQANERWRAWGAALTKEMHCEVFSAFVDHAWPLWLTWQISGRDQTADSLRRRAALTTGLDIIAHLLRSRTNQHMREMVG